MSDVIRASQLSRAFNGQPAVRALDLAVPKESVYAFLGPNAAGKSTTIRLLLGLLKPEHVRDGGRVPGRPISDLWSVVK